MIRLDSIELSKSSEIDIFRDRISSKIANVDSIDINDRLLFIDNLVVD
jgi:hypothetical protein